MIPVLLPLLSTGILTPPAGAPPVASGTAVAAAAAAVTVDGESTGRPIGFVG